MIHRPANIPLSPAAAARLDRYLLQHGQGFNAALLRREHEAEFARLDALPDAALAAMGLRRDGLAAHVFRNVLPQS